MSLWSELQGIWLEDSTATSVPNVKIPPLPDVALRVVQEAANGAGAQELGELISRDAGLTCELLKFVNSATTGLRNPIATPQRAAAILGIRKLKFLVLTTAVHRSTQAIKSPLVMNQRFGVAGLERGVFSRELVRQIGGDADLAFSAGILQDFMLLALTAEMPEQYITLLQIVEQTGRSLADVEREVLGWDHAQAASQVMAAWGFPDDLVVCVRVHHEWEWLWNNPQTRGCEAMAIALASLLPDFLGQVPEGISRLQTFEHDFFFDDLPRFAESVADQLCQLAPNLHGHTPLAKHLPGLATPSGSNAETAG